MLGERLLDAGDLVEDLGLKDQRAAGNVGGKLPEPGGELLPVPGAVERKGIEKGEFVEFALDQEALRVLADEVCYVPFAENIEALGFGQRLDGLPVVAQPGLEDGLSVAGCNFREAFLGPAEGQPLVKLRTRETAGMSLENLHERNDLAGG